MAFDDTTGEVTISEDAGSTDVTSLILENDRDPDQDVLFVTAIDDQTTAGTLRLTNGVVTYDPGGEFESLAQGATALQSFSYTVDDGTGATDTANVTVVVIGQNDSPSIDQAELNAISENSPAGTLVGAVTASDVDGDALSFEIADARFEIDSAGRVTVAENAVIDFENSPNIATSLIVRDVHGATSVQQVTIELLNQPSIVGLVFVDVNGNDLFDANEVGLDGVTIELLDENGNPTGLSIPTSDGGLYLFEDLEPGIYQVHEEQVTGVDDGHELLGSLGGTILGNDTMKLTLVREDAFDYVFTELGQELNRGDAAGIGFWQNKHGQSLIEAGGQDVGDWLASNFGNVFGDVFETTSVADFYKEQLFKQKGQKSAGPAHVDAQFMAVALATYFTSRQLAGDVAESYGFTVTDTGIGSKVVNVGSRAAAFGVDENTDLTIQQLLLATNVLTDTPDDLMGFAAIYDKDGNGEIDEAEATLRAMANGLYSEINESGDR